MIGLPEALILFSEVTLASYPILIKSVPTNLWTQIVSRMAVYGALAFTALLQDFKQLQAVSIANTAGAGLLNLLHIATSYKAFSELPAGDAMAIFYAYPVWNLLGAWLIFGEKLPLTTLPWVALAFIGMFMVAQPKVGSLLSMEKPFATFCALMSGVTESAIYFFFKLMGKDEGTFKGMFELYGGSFFWMLPVILAGEFSSSVRGSNGFVLPKIDFSWKVWLPMILFNVFVGFTGYAMRFAAIPMVSTLIFSTLNFAGIVAAYGFGYIFQGEKPSWTAAGGSLAIIIANAVILSKTSN
jgi:drug/metabolite transporter (DMT)-like permease